MPIPTCWMKLPPTTPRFNNEMKLANASFDGLEVHKCYVDYGPTRFLGLVYSKLDHPTVCRTSNGAPRWGWFEFRFNSVQKALGLSKSHSIPKRLQVRVGLHKDHHPAPGPYAATYAIPPNAVESHAWMSLQEQDGLHGVRRETLERFGLAEHYAKTIRAWRALGPKLPKHVRTRILNAYEGGGHYPLQREHFRPRQSPRPDHGGAVLLSCAQKGPRPGLGALSRNTVRSSLISTCAPTPKAWRPCTTPTKRNAPPSFSGL